MSFAVPPPSERLQAISPLAGLPEPVKRALEPRGEFFDPLPAPGPNDWLANHPEPGQPFERFLHSQPNRPDAPRRKLYLQPLGEFAEDEAPALGLLRQFAAGFFGMEIGVLPSVDLTRSAISVRRNPHTRNTQLLTADILTLLRRWLPEDGYALLGITMEDLYPEPSWNFVFGQASLRHRVGAYTFTRYYPRFYQGTAPEDERALLLRRSCKVLAHEMAHMFGIRHCV
jgi:archaemetzincin